MKQFKFEDAVCKAFSFLLENGFSLESREGTRVSYVSERYRIILYLGRRSHEIGFEFGPIHPTPSGYASLRTLVAAFDRHAARKLSNQVPVMSDDDALQRVETLADEFQKHVKLESLNVNGFWDRVMKEGQIAFEEKYPSLTSDQFTARLRALMTNHKYDDVIDMLSTMEEHLDADQRNVLTEARRATKRLN